MATCKLYDENVAADLVTAMDYDYAFGAHDEDIYVKFLMDLNKVRLILFVS